MGIDVKINLPDEVKFIIDVLSSRGFAAYAVGGCVRDSVAGRPPSDWDIATNAFPHEVACLFDKTVKTGLKHGTVTILLNRGSFEVTTFRIDGIYSDNRRPESVSFTSSLEEDLSRRDFTVNSIAYNPITDIIDPFGGLEDIKRKTIKAVGSPDVRFNEDALRMLRAVRFSAQLAYKIDDSTFNAITRNSKLISNISAERIRDELSKLLLSDNPSAFSLLYESGLLKYIMPAFEACFTTMQNNPHHIYDVARHTLTAVSIIDRDPVLRWAMLLHDIGKPETKSTDSKGVDHFYGHPEKSFIIAQEILKKLKFDNKSSQKILRLVRYHDRIIGIGHKPVRKAIKAIGEDIFPLLIKVKKADIEALNPAFIPEKLRSIEEIKLIYEDIIEKKQCLTLKDLAINGHDLISEGLQPGGEIGKILDTLLNAVIDNPALNNRDSLLEIAKRFVL